MLLDAYSRWCAISDCDAPDALEAAHISPYRGGHTDRVDNGLLLRADLHSLFDLGLLGVDAESWTVVTASALDGTVYAALDGQRIRTPARAADQPNRELPKKHLSSNGLRRGRARVAKGARQASQRDAASEGRKERDKGTAAPRLRRSERSERRAKRGGESPWAVDPHDHATDHDLITTCRGLDALGAGGRPPWT